MRTRYQTQQELQHNLAYLMALHLIHHYMHTNFASEEQFLFMALARSARDKLEDVPNTLSMYFYYQNIPVKTRKAIKCSTCLLYTYILLSISRTLCFLCPTRDACYGKCIRIIIIIIIIHSFNYIPPL